MSKRQGTCRNCGREGVYLVAGGLCGRKTCYGDPDVRKRHVQPRRPRRKPGETPKPTKRVKRPIAKGDNIEPVDLGAVIRGAFTPASNALREAARTLESVDEVMADEFAKLRQARHEYIAAAAKLRERLKALAAVDED